MMIGPASGFRRSSSGASTDDFGRPGNGRAALRPALLITAAYRGSV